MSGSNDEIQNIYLKPGEIWISEKPAIVSTVLGSCVSVTFFSKALSMGGICHGKLPECIKDDPFECNSFKYVDSAILAILKEFEKQRIKTDEIEVKLFGGSEILKRSGVSSKISIGKLNVEKAIKLLEEKKIKIIASDVGGPVGRKILFYSHTGEVFLKRLKNMDHID